MGREIQLFTDGSSLMDKYYNKVVGAWAYCLVEKGRMLYGNKGVEVGATNNQMEIKAAIEGLAHLSNFYSDTKIEVFSDSEYLVKGANIWYYTWEKGGRLGLNSSIKNLDLWKELMILKDSLDSSFNWIKGHSGNEFNEYVDLECALATNGFLSAISEDYTLDYREWGEILKTIK